jgi:hypothetical protein
MGNKRSAPCRVESVRDGVEAVLEEVSVEVERHRRGLVPEHLLHDLQVGSGRDREARGGVPKLVLRTGKPNPSSV